MNSIPEIQNREWQLKQLAAQRQLYSEAKTTLVWQMLVTLGLGIAFSLSLVLLKEEGIELWVAKTSRLVNPLFGKSVGVQEFIAIVEKLFAFLSMLIALLDALVLEPRQKRLAQQAAKIQEAFDCDVLDLPWQELKTGDRPAEELINEKAEKHRRSDPLFSKLKDWYSPGVGQLPLAVARVLCQRVNIWWDAGLRKRYANWLAWGLLSILLLLVILGMLRGMPLSDFIYSMLIPMLPAFLWTIREHKKQQETASTLDRLHTAACKLWERALKRKLADGQLKQASRDLQNEIYDHRRSAPFIFDWIYNRLRKADEAQMNKNSGDLVQEYLKKPELPSSTTQPQLDPVEDDETEIREQHQKEV